MKYTITTDNKEKINLYLISPHSIEKPPDMDEEEFKMIEDFRKMLMERLNEIHNSD